MFDSILKFAEQLSFKPEIKNGPIDAHGKKIIFAGMGGSCLAGDLLQIFDPSADIVSHRDYGLPAIPQNTLAESLLIASSYSGNTEETLDFLEHALRIGLRPAVIASGGKLLARAEEERLPYIQIPDNVIQPRVAVGLSLKALAMLAGRHDLISELERIATVLIPKSEENEGKRIAEALSGFIPLVYSSNPNRAIAYNWKIKINETAKTAIFTNVFSELNHNELAGFAKNEKAPRAPFKLLLIRDSEDHKRVQKRIDITASLLHEQGIDAVETNLSGTTRIERALRSLVTADWAAYHLARAYGVDPDTIPAIEEFKKRMRT